LSMKALKEAGDKHKRRQRPPAREVQPKVHDDRANAEARGSNAADKKSDARLVRHKIQGWGFRS